jgi:hypothetical protein
MPPSGTDLRALVIWRDYCGRSDKDVKQGWNECAWKIYIRPHLGDYSTAGPIVSCFESQTSANSNKGATLIRVYVYFQLMSDRCLSTPIDGRHL